MALPDKLLLSDLLGHRVRCDLGLDHGFGISGWMHPPVHRLLGWISKPSSLKLKRDVWRLDQLRGMANQEVYVKGSPSESDEAMINRFPTLLDADLLSVNNQRLGLIADLVFQPKTGQILEYLVSRSDPRIPGTSRWRLSINHILDQQPGMVSTDLLSLDDLPISKSSLRQDFLSNSRKWRDKLQKFSNKTTDRLEGWLEELPWESNSDSYLDKDQYNDKDPLMDGNESNKYNDNTTTSSGSDSSDNEDFWI